MFSKKLLIITLMFFSALSYSQVEIDKNGGSVYSIFGLGELNFSSGTRTDAMGILGIGLPGNYMNSFNPSAWVRTGNTRFTTKFNLKNFRSSDGVNDAERTYAAFDGFNLAIPANENNGWTLDLGLYQYSVINYDIRFDRTYEDEKYTQFYSGNGGLSRIAFGSSYLLSKNIGLGVQFNYNFGNIRRTNIIDFENNNLYNTNNEETNSLSGFYFNAGLMFMNLGRIINSRPLSGLNVGLSFTTPMTLNSSIAGRYFTIAGIDSVQLSENDIRVPWAAGLGISNTFGRYLLVAADVYYQPWDNYKVNDVHPEEIKNSLRLGLGMEYRRSTRLEDSYVSRIAYRLGFTYDMSYLRILNEDINAMSVNAGLQLPVSRNNAIDLSFSYTRRGKNEGGLVLDNIFRVGAAVNIGELWFLRPRTE